MKADDEGERPWSKDIPPGPWDYIVIGSGMGGMTSAALLASLGRRVLVLEQHYVPGGFTHVFKRPGFHWDVGVHAVGEVTTHTATGRILRELTRGELEWAPLGGVYDRFHFPDDFTIEFPDSPALFRENLIDAFPNEREAIDGYLHLVRAVAKEMKSYYLARLFGPSLGRVVDPVLARGAQRWLTKRTADVLRELTSDPKLRAVLTSQWGYYGSTPSRSSFAIQALVAKHFMHGAYYPVGGAGRIARGLLATVERAGGWTAIRTDVEQILVENGRAVGVRLRDGREVRSKRVISAAGVLSTVTRLLPPPYRDDAWAREVAELPAAPAHVCLYLGFEGNPREAGATAANEWFYETWDMEEDAWRVNERDAPPRASVLYCSFPSQKDPEHDPDELQHTGEIVTFVPWDSFSKWKDARWKKRGAEYDAFKDRLSEQLLSQLTARMPGLAPKVKLAELGTPVSTHHFVRPVEGSIYGLEPTARRFHNRWLRPRAPIDGLFFSGSEVATVGVIGAMMGGVLAAVSAEPVEAVRWLRPIAM
ncbi:phytoene desaturase family protein [Sandaracinus amylolyticus]|uniref:Carotenoid cis-trans isomerase n=1 Tax=Sandaracinus amylolyticus TaxID=927083 RepID=A0A0F6W0H0_9BACT|nr:NAD(P)/FAD-dependent oxidoreductase [Sandaracinus amylolyticus]AKF04140.1 Carotenoid cis-trans isomerase [Sandaracinus amylolyticus]